MDTTILSEDGSKLKSKGKIAARGVLLIISKNFFGQTFIIDQQEITIGRNKVADFVINDDLISREHCLVGIDEEHHFYIEDLDSTNSSLLNSKKLKKRKALYYGDKICLGETILRFFREETAQ
ncbi:MAG: FHA domain-containing protein [Spirochaetaceae bacterium]|jgi:pSer/pThr/pTyr-binding forkhead associated (FHA) protein|nr:FHA domain-containing protein [Spirochaetaceae bacterium]